MNKGERGAEENISIIIIDSKVVEWFAEGWWRNVLTSVIVE